MPELPEVETIVRALRKPLAGRRVIRAWIRYASLYRRGSRRVTWVTDRVITAVGRLGKNAVLRLAPGGVMTVNLGMTGRLVVARHAGTDGGHGGRTHLHARFLFDNGVELRYYDPRRFGYIYITSNDDIRDELGIGPDPFEVGGRGAQLAAILRRKSAPIKSILLDQHLLSGIGNIYADETLFAARIDPLTRGAAAVPRIETLLSSAREILTHAIAHGGSTVRDYRRPDGSSGSFQQHHAVYGRGGEPCIECGATIERIVISGRSTHFCPVCQV